MSSLSDTLRILIIIGLGVEFVTNKKYIHHKR